MKEFLLRLFDYDEWAISQSLSSLEAPDNPEAQLMLSHVLSAERIWLIRLKGEDSSGVKVFEGFSLEECARMAGELHTGYAEFIDSLAEEDFGRVLTYKNTKGVEFSTSIGDILTHVGLHGMYHRGQVALLVRQGGGTAVSTDYINFTRL
jgi:uncharacterized damage-inducible protein DinB